MVTARECRLVRHRVSFGETVAGVATPYPRSGIAIPLKPKEGLNGAPVWRVWELGWESCASHISKSRCRAPLFVALGVGSDVGHPPSSRIRVLQ